MPNRNGTQATLARIDEALNGEFGLTARTRVIETKLNSIELILVGGINAATGEEEAGLAQSFKYHLQEHRKQQRRNMAIITIIATGFASFFREILRLFHVG